MTRSLCLSLVLLVSACAGDGAPPSSAVITDRGIGGTGTPPVQIPPSARVRDGAATLSVTSDGAVQATGGKPKP